MISVVFTGIPPFFESFAFELLVFWSSVVSLLLLSLQSLSLLPFSLPTVSFLSLSGFCLFFGSAYMCQGWFGSVLLFGHILPLCLNMRLLRSSLGLSPLSCFCDIIIYFSVMFNVCCSFCKWNLFEFYWRKLCWSFAKVKSVFLMLIRRIGCLP